MKKLYVLAKIARFLFGTICILHILAILTWFMAPKELIVTTVQKSFYPPFINSYVIKYEGAKEEYKKAEEVTAKFSFEEKEHELVGYVALNTFIMTIIFFVCWLVSINELDRIKNKKIKQ